MKAKQKSILLTIVMIIGLLPSCKKDFLDKNPTDAVASEVFWKTDADVNLALTGVYRRLQSGFYGHRKLWLDTYSDNALDHWTFYDFETITTGTINSSNVPATFYNVPYQGIAGCNFFLDNIDKAPTAEATKNIYKAEVKFLRAMFYFDLVQSFGDVVLFKTAPKSVEEAKVKKTPKLEVLKFVHDELDFAIANLPNTLYSGHAVKGSAQALQAKVYLFEQNWKKAAELANNVMTGGAGFKIYQGGYQNLFLTVTQQDNPEIIFSTKYLAPNNPQGDEGILVEIGWYGCVGPYQNLIDEYETTDGKMINEVGSIYNPASPFANRDPRLRLTVKLPTEPYINPDGSIFGVGDLVKTGYSQKKYVDLTKLPFDRGKITSTDMNIIHIRYADVLLMYAEAKNEDTGPDATIYEALNLIRKRTGINMPEVNQTVYNTKDKLRDFILHERRVELALEGHRYYDLKRRNLMAAKFAPLKTPGGAQLVFGEKNNVLPIPQAEIDKSKPYLEQNAGY